MAEQLTPTEVDLGRHSRLSALSVVLLGAAALSLVSTVYWAITAMGQGLYWDDVNGLQAVADLRRFPFQPQHWGEMLSGHPPTAYFVYYALLTIFPNTFPLSAHILQALTLVALLAITFKFARDQKMTRVMAAAVIGLVLSWPLVAGGVQEITPDLAAGFMGVVAILLVANGRLGLGFGSLLVAGCLQFTGVGFLPSVLLLLWRRGKRRLSLFAAYIVGGTLPILWGFVSWLRGAPGRDFELIHHSGILAFPKLWLINGSRLALELLVYDGRWTLTLGLVVLWMSYRAWPTRFRSVTAPSFGAMPADVAMSMAAISVFLEAAVVGVPDGLERYLLPLAVPIAWVAVRLATISSKAGHAVLALTIVAGLVTCFLPNAITWPDRALSSRYPGLGRDTNPTWISSFVRVRQQAISQLNSESPGTVGTPWPVSVYVSEPAAGYVDSPIAGREWYPGQSSCGLDLVWVDESRTTHYSVEVRELVDAQEWSDGRYRFAVGRPSGKLACTQ